MIPPIFSQHPRWNRFPLAGSRFTGVLPGRAFRLSAAGLLLWLLFLGCSDVKDVQPAGRFETGTGPLKEFRLSLDTVNLQGTIRLDSLAEGGNFTLRFTPLTFGSIRIVEEGKAVEIRMQKSNWRADSTRYTICKNGVCREGEIKVRNRSWFVPDTLDPPPPDTACLVMPVRTFYLPFLGSVDIRNLYPQAGVGTLQNLTADFYTVSKTGDSVLNYTAAGGFQEQAWAWDTIRYSGLTAQGRCFRGKVALVLGDTCEPQARDDFFTIPAGKALWPETALTANDLSCLSTLGSYLTRTATEFDYGNYKVMPTSAGVLTDTLVNGNQHYKYQRTQPGSSEDSFIYYFKNNTSGRVTKARVRIRF